MTTNMQQTAAIAILQALCLPVSVPSASPLLSTICLEEFSSFFPFLFNLHVAHAHSSAIRAPVPKAPACQKPPLPRKPPR